MQEELRKLPSVDRMLQEEDISALAKEHGHGLVVTATRGALEEARHKIIAGATCPSVEVLVGSVVEGITASLRPSLRPVINATGVIIHTNLGRAPLSDATRAAMQEAALGYSNLEFDLEEGQRGSRYVHTTELLCRLTGAEAALVVNNNAGAVLLMLTALAKGKEVIISRGQLVEIGGGFRIPEVMQQSGAYLVEVGTTNRTYLHDYEAAIGEKTVAFMRAHRSNFSLTGFVHEPALEELVALAHERDLLMLDDLGSGVLLDTAQFSLAHEPMMQESISAGVDLVSASGDKLLGGPQAGIILGRGELIERLKRFPLTRALRVDKIAIFGLQATLLHYLKGEAVNQVPIWRMIATSVEEIEGRARAWAEGLADLGVSVGVANGESTVGGGSLPGETLPTKLLTIETTSPDELARRLRTGEPAVVGRIERDMLLLDPRTVLPAEDDDLLRALRQALP